MIRIRNSIFETNSSSVHTLSVIRKPSFKLPNKKVFFNTGIFGWDSQCYEDTNNKAAYLYTAILMSDKREEYLQKLIDILTKNLIEFEFKPIEEGLTTLEMYNEGCYIEHYSYLENWLEVILENDILVLNFLFSKKSFVCTGNDNDSQDEPQSVNLKSKAYFNFEKGN